MIPAAAYLRGEYGVDGLFVGVPAVLGASGVESVVELDLTDEEKAQFADSVEHVRELVGEVDKRL